MRVTSPRIPAVSSAVSRVLRASRRLSPASSSTAAEALAASEALSEAVLLSAGVSSSKHSCSPGSEKTGSPPYSVGRPVGWAESAARIFNPAERVSQPFAVCMA